MRRISTSQPPRQLLQTRNYRHKRTSKTIVRSRVRREELRVRTGNLGAGHLELQPDDDIDDRLLSLHSPEQNSCIQCAFRFLQRGSSIGDWMQSKQGITEQQIELQTPQSIPSVVQHRQLIVLHTTPLPTTLPLPVCLTVPLCLLLKDESIRILTTPSDSRTQTKHISNERR